MGNTYDRDKLFGAAEGPRVPRRSVVVRKPAGGRMKEGERLELGGAEAWAGWKAGKAEVVAEFDDGTAAVFTNRVETGIVASFAMDAATAARDLPDVVRDVLDAVLAVTGGRHAVDVLGASEEVDLASCTLPGGARAVVVNHAAAAIDVVIVPHVPAAQGGEAGVWTDLVTGQSRPGRAADGGLAVTVPPRGFICWEYRK
jgi:hypothetical protein